MSQVPEEQITIMKSEISGFRIWNIDVWNMDRYFVPIPDITAHIPDIAVLIPDINLMIKLLSRTWTVKTVHIPAVHFICDARAG